jgi:hypothetical protein
LSFNLYYFGRPFSGDEDAFSAEQAEAAVDAFLKRMAPGELEKTRLETSRTPTGEHFGSRWGNYDFGYIRYENDIPFRDNRISVEFNLHTGKITSFSLNWFENATFPDIDNVLEPLMALTAFVEQNGSTIRYITTGGGNAALVYDFRSLDLIDPFTGKALDHTGTQWTDSTVMPAYDDVAGHWSESIVTRLLDNGVFLWGGRFEPQRVMTEFEFLQYIMVIEPSFFARREPVAYLSGRGLNIEASQDRSLTRQVAARIIVEYLGYGRLAGQSEWFVFPFTDNVADEYRGFVTICYMLGIVGGDDGRFNATNNVTRAHAAAMLHNLIIS